MNAMAVTTQRDSREQKLHDLCALLAQMISCLKPLHSSPSTTSNQGQLLETVIGAAIWYLPDVFQLWTGKASTLAVKSLKAGDLKNVSKDHETPRKVAARRLLGLSDELLSADNVYRLYTECFGRFNLVTKAENRLLMRFQRADVFISPDQAYIAAGIELVDAFDLPEARKRVGILKKAKLVKERFRAAAEANAS
jgi:hypothetical protein